tara:strand:+ start:25848 stop:26345 length:498 start_codon:yes stop_codon:yes gene_type:complete
MLNLRKPESQAATPTPAATRSILDRYPTPDTGRYTPSPEPRGSMPEEGPTDFVIGRGTNLKGEIDAQGDVIVEGTVEASIHAATMRLESGGSVKGEANVANAEIKGCFEGSLHVRECLTVCSDGVVTGSIRYRELKVDKGGQITGDMALAEAGSKPPTPVTVDDD